MHANDWQTALVPVYVNTVEWSKPLHAAPASTRFTTWRHQGVWGEGALFITGLGREHYRPAEFEHFGTMNLTKAALYHSTLLTTVSPTYSREIQTSDHGFGLDGVLRDRRTDLFGVLNGIDLEEWSPETDPLHPGHFSPTDLRAR